MMVLVVTGGRDFDNRAAVYAALDSLADVSFTLYQGGCRGADALAAEWAHARGIPERVFPADWARLGRAAGQQRNRQMLSAALSAADDGCALLAFAGGRGTAGCVSSAHALGIPVIKVT